MQLIRVARQAGGTWLLGPRGPGRVWFEVDVAAGEPCKWVTPFGTRVLDWWDSDRARGPDFYANCETNRHR